MTKNLLTIALVLLLGACSSSNNDELIINVEVENMTSSKVDLIIDRTTGFTVQLDKDGKGSVKIPGYDNIYAQVIYNQDSHEAFFQRGVENTIHFDARKFRNEMAVLGINKAANDYLQSVRYSELNAYDLSWPDFKAKMKKLTDEALEILKIRDLDSSCPNFAKIERERIKYIYAQPILVYPMGHQMKTNDTSYKPEEDMFSTLDGLIVEHEELAYVPEYRDFLRFAIPMQLQHQGKEIKNSYERTVTTMQYIADNFKSQMVRQTMIRSLALEYFQNEGIRGTEELQKIANNYLTDPIMIEDYRNAIEKYDITAVGKKSPDFSAEDINGKVYSLNDFNGKYLYIDVWATWCAPCKNELPYLQKVVSKFEGYNISFLGLNTDKNKADWKNALNGNTLPGIQLWLGDNSDFLRDYGIDGIPRFIILSPDGKIVDPNAVRPSSDDIESILNKLIEVK